MPKQVSSSFGICFVSSYPPRHCGIGTFTKNISNHLKIDRNRIRIVAISDRKKTYHYGKEVMAEIIQDDYNSYLHAAAIINQHRDIHIVNLQHVFSLFGGAHGENILHFLERLRKPVVTTFHMVYEPYTKPHTFEVVDSSYSKMTQAIIEHSKKIIVIIQPIADLLEQQYDVDPKKIAIIPHGTPFLKKQNPARYKRKLGFGPGRIITSFGLIRQKKGLEYAIAAMPDVLKIYPDTKLLILGESHPNRPREYYLSLVRQAKRLKLLNKQVFFNNKYLTYREIVDYLQASDIFITPYLVPNQNSSGAIAYAMACGKVVIATPFTYAQEVLSEGRGEFIRYADSSSIVSTLDMLFSHPKKMKKIQEKAYQYAQNNSFDIVASKYLSVFKEVFLMSRSSSLQKKS